jgi:hypothetical protein
MDAAGGELRVQRLAQHAPPAHCRGMRMLPGVAAHRGGRRGDQQRASKSVALRLARVPEVFQERAARAHGLDSVLLALDVLEEAGQKASPRRASGPGRGTLPLKPPK